MLLLLQEKLPTSWVTRDTSRLLGLLPGALMAYGLPGYLLLPGDPALWYLRRHFPL